MSGITLRYWAGARAAAGCASEFFAVTTVRDALAAARAARRDPHFDRVLTMCSLLLDGAVVDAAGLDLPHADSVEVEVLPPFAGGAVPQPAGPIGAGRFRHR